MTRHRVITATALAGLAVVAGCARTDPTASPGPTTPPPATATTPSPTGEAGPGVERFAITDIRAGDASATVGGHLVIPSATGLVELAGGSVVRQVATTATTLALWPQPDRSLLWEAAEGHPVDPNHAGPLLLVKRRLPDLTAIRTVTLDAPANLDTARHAVVASGDRVFVVAHGDGEPSRVLAVDAGSMTVVARHTLGGTHGMQGGDYLHLAVMGTTVLAARSDGWVSALDRTTLREVWSRHVGDQCLDIAADAGGAWVVTVPSGAADDAASVVALDTAGHVRGHGSGPANTVATDGSGQAWVAGSIRTPSGTQGRIEAFDRSGRRVRTLAAGRSETSPALTSVEVGGGYVLAGWAQDDVVLRARTG